MIDRCQKYFNKSNVCPFGSQWWTIEAEHLHYFQYICIPGLKLEKKTLCVSKFLQPGVGVEAVVGTKYVVAGDSPNTRATHISVSQSSIVMRCLLISYSCEDLRTIHIGNGEEYNLYKIHCVMMTQGHMCTVDRGMYSWLLNTVQTPWRNNIFLPPLSVRQSRSAARAFHSNLCRLFASLLGTTCWSALRQATLDTVTSLNLNMPEKKKVSQATGNDDSVQ